MEEMTVKKLREILKHFPEEFEMWAHEKGAPYDIRVDFSVVCNLELKRITLQLKGTV